MKSHRAFSPTKVLNTPQNNTGGRFGSDGSIRYFSCNPSSYEVTAVMTNSSLAGKVFGELSEVGPSLTRRGFVSVKTVKPRDASTSLKIKTVMLWWLSSVHHLLGRNTAPSPLTFVRRELHQATVRDVEWFAGWPSCSKSLPASSQAGPL